MATKHPNSPTRLTEFAPLSSDTKSSGGFFSRLFKKGSATDLPSSPAREFQEQTATTPGPPPLAAGPAPAVTPESADTLPKPGETISLILPVEGEPSPDMSESSSSPGGPVISEQTRTLSSVLKRLSTILDRRSQTPQAYKDSDFKQYWMPDSNCHECYQCGDKFNTFRRRHHCRICGQIFCSRCCNQEVPGKIMGYTGSLRVCTYCCKVVLSYAQNPDVSGDLKSLSEDLQEQLMEEDSETPQGSPAPQHDARLWPPTLKRKGRPSNRMSTIFDDDSQIRTVGHAPEGSSSPGPLPYHSASQSDYPSLKRHHHSRRALLKDSAQLRELWSVIQHPEEGLEMQSHRHRLRTYPSCMVSSQLVDWLIARDKAMSRVQAIAIGQALMDAGWLQCVTSHDQVFRDEYALYRPGESAMRDSPPEPTEVPEPPVSEEDEDDDAEPLWFKEIKRSEDTDSLSELSKIPATVSVPEDLDMGSRSVFYVDSQSSPSESHRPRLRATSAASNERGDRDVAPEYMWRHPDAVGLTSQWNLLESGSYAVNGQNTWVSVENDGQCEEIDLANRESTDSIRSTEVHHGIPGTFKAKEETLPPGLPHRDSTSSGLRLTEELFTGAFSRSASTLSGGSVQLETSSGWRESEKLREDNGERIAFDRLRVTHTEHMNSLCVQLLQNEALSQKWADTVLTVARRVAHTVQPDIKHDGDDMDIRQYVLVKKIPGGTRSQTAITYGVVCSKNVAHKKMRQCIPGCKILLLRAPIEYQRVENKFSSLEPQILQEREFLKHCVGRIAALDPDVLLVEKTVSRVAQDFLLESGITLILNVKPSVLERVSRFTQADIITSIDGLVSKQALGFCHTFKTHTFTLSDGSSKTLMYFDGCASHLGCTVTLRGGSSGELGRVKRVLQFMTYVAYHSKLEVSFLMDEFALPPLFVRSHDDSFQIINADTRKSENGVVPDANQIGVSNQHLNNDSTSNTSQDRSVSDDRESSQGSHRDSPQRNNADVMASRAKTNSPARGHGSADSIPNSPKQSPAHHQTPDPSCKKCESPQEHQTLTAAEAPSGGPCQLQVDTQLGGVDACRSDQLRARCSPRTIKDSSTVVLDQSDPLHHYQISKDESIFHSQGSMLREEVQAVGRRFKRCLDDVILSTSPGMKYDIPYLETDTGSKCKLRSYFPATDLYWSEIFVSGSDRKRRYIRKDEEEKLRKIPAGIAFPPPHPFVTEKITAPITDPKTQALLADFRARGGRIQALNVAQKASNTQRNMDKESSPPQWGARVDCLDPNRHQRLAVLLSSFSYESPNAPNPCVNPWVVTMDYYGRNDLTLGSFLERYCFRETYECPSESCDTPMVEHIRRFVHDSSGLQVILKRLDTPMPTTNNILMWGWCKRCKEVTPVVPMSLETWSTSFAKYLELRFHANSYCRRGTDTCSHSLHHDHFQYFGYGHMVASFKFFPISLREIALPPMVVNIDLPEIPKELWLKDKRLPSGRSPGVYANILDHLLRLQRDAQTDAHASLLGEYIIQLQGERENLRRMMEKLQEQLKRMLVTADEEEDEEEEEDKDEKEDESELKLDAGAGLEVLMCSTPEDMLMVWAITDLFVEIKRLIAETVHTWSNRIHDFELQQKKLEKLNMKEKVTSTARREGGTPESVINVPVADPVSTRSWSSKEDDMESEPTFVIGDRAIHASVGGAPAANHSEGSMPAHSTTVCYIGSVDSQSQILDMTPHAVQPGPVSQLPAGELVVIDPSHFASTPPQSQPLRLEGGTPDRPASSLAAGVTDSMSSASSKGSSHSSTGRSQGKSCSIDELDSFPKPQGQGQGQPQQPQGQQVQSAGLSESPKGHNRSKSLGESKKVSKQMTLARESSSQDLEKKSMKTLLTSLLSGSEPASVPSPFGADEHYILPPSERVPIAVYDQEPSSIIAYTLSSPEYDSQLQDLKVQLLKDGQAASPATKRSSRTSEGPTPSFAITSDLTESCTSLTKRGSSSMLSFFRGRDKSPSQRGGGSSGGGSGGGGGGGGVTQGGKFEVEAVKYTPRLDRDSLDDTDDPDFALQTVPVSSTDKGSSGKSNKEQQSNLHIELQFFDNNARFFCRVYFAEQFRQLRKLIFPEGEERFVRSLSRCFTWLTGGGKSGSTFCKTQDDRFILKQMSRHEVHSFVDFAPHYFQYVTTAYNEQKPTVLAKILGVYKIGFRNSQTSATLKQDLLVMENLFYGRKISQIFDLKGSLRNRLVNISGKRVEELVLLDENLLKLSVDSPMYIRPHSKTVLTLAITNDTQFLSGHSVMDYSLLVGLDDTKKELVVGIIDYIRTFTWDKRLEMVVKTTYNTLGGGPGKMPTVVSPELYRNRFLEAMDRYFLLVPDRWTGLGRNVDS